jgi:hypothetical protein
VEIKSILRKKVEKKLKIHYLDENTIYIYPKQVKSIECQIDGVTSKAYKIILRSFCRLQMT